MIQRILALVLIGVVFLVPLGVLIQNPPQPDQVASLPELENYLKENFLFGGELRDMAARLTIASGQTQHEGIFYTDDGLVEDYWPSASETVPQGNTAAIINFAQRGGVPTFAMLIPTAVAVKQKMVPEKAPLYNQKRAIEEIYNNFSGHVTAVDVYPVLYQRYDATGEYLYCRTDPALTALGGHLIYTQLAERMRLSPHGLREFDKEYPVHNYYGSLYQRWSYKEVEGDILTVYRYHSDRVGYRVSSTDDRGNAVAYRTLFPVHKVWLGDPYDIYLGGLAPRVDIQVVEQDMGDSLLVFGDATAISYLPFLALHYGTVTLIDLAALPRAELEALDVAAYDRVLFAYSLDTYMDSDALQKVKYVARES